MASITLLTKGKLRAKKTYYDYSLEQCNDGFYLPVKNDWIDYYGR